MKVPLDECVPRPLKGFDVFTAQEMGWAAKRNGELLRLAEQQFDVFVTLDRHVHEQQNLKSYQLAVVILLTPNRVHEILPHLSDLKRALLAAPSGEASFVGW